MNPYHDIGFMPPFIHPFGLIFLPLFVLVAAWTIIIKGYALWCAARSEQKGWFIALLIVNTLGILEILYLVWFRGERAKASASASTETADGLPVAESSPADSA